MKSETTVPPASYSLDVLGRLGKPEREGGRNAERGGGIAVNPFPIPVGVGRRDTGRVEGGAAVRSGEDNHSLICIGVAILLPVGGLISGDGKIEDLELSHTVE